MNLIYGAINNNVFYSNRSEIKLRALFENGIYSMDMDEDDFKSTITIADINDARAYFKKASNIEILRGITLNDGIIPENPIGFKRIPIRVKDPSWDNFEEYDIVKIKNIYYPLQSVSTKKAYSLIDVQDLIKNKNYEGINSLKDITPDIRVAFTFAVVEIRLEEQRRMEEELAKLREEQRKLDMIPANYLKRVLEETGAEVISVKKINRGFEVFWKSNGHTINTLFDKDFAVIEAGFCVSGYDKTQSAHSVANLLQQYVEDGDYIHKTRTTY